MTQPKTTVSIPPAAVDRAAGRRGSIAGVLLLFASCLPLLGATLLTPNLANMGAAFYDAENLALLLSLVVTAPGAMIAVLAPFAGWISDRFGRKRLLLIAVVAYSIFGVVPIFLNSLLDVVLSRVLLGVCEAFVMTICTALIADYFQGARRAKYLGLQTVFTSVSAVVFVLIGGAVAQSDWRAPFFIYLFGIVLAIPLAVFAWEPLGRNATDSAAAAEAEAEHPGATAPGFPWRLLALPIVFTLYSGIANGVVTINASFMLPERGFSDNTADIGIITAILSVGTAASALSFRWLARFGPRRLLPVAYTVQATGLLIVAFVDSVPAYILGGLLAQIGFGIQLPTLITWALSGLRDKRTQGRASGLWTSAFWLGQLLFSFIFTGLATITGTQFGAVAVFGIVAAAFAVAAIIFIPRNITIVHTDEPPAVSAH